MRNSYFHVSPKTKLFMGIQHISLNNSKNTFPTRNRSLQIFPKSLQHFLEVFIFKSATTQFIQYFRKVGRFYQFIWYFKKFGRLYSVYSVFQKSWETLLSLFGISEKLGDFTQFIRYFRKVGRLQVLYPQGLY